MKINDTEITKDILLVAVGIVICALVAGFILGLGVLKLIQG